MLLWTSFILKTAWIVCIFYFTRSCQLNQTFWKQLVSSTVLLFVDFHIDNSTSSLSESPCSSYLLSCLVLNLFYDSGGCREEEILQLRAPFCYQKMWEVKGRSLIEEGLCSTAAVLSRIRELDSSLLRTY